MTIVRDQGGNTTPGLNSLGVYSYLKARVDSMREALLAGMNTAIIVTQSSDGGIKRYAPTSDVYGPTMQRFEREDLQQQQVERALNEIGRFAQEFLSWLPRAEYTKTPGKREVSPTIEVDQQITELLAKSSRPSTNRAAAP